MKKKIKKFAEGGETLSLSDEARGSLNLDTGENNAAPATFRLNKANNSSMWDRFGVPNQGNNPGSMWERFGVPKQANNSSIFDRMGLKKGGAVKKKTVKKTKISSASKRADGCITKGKTKGKMV